MSWLNLQVNEPLALWTALALFIPLIIHLISRSELRRQPFAFTRLLPKLTIPIEHKLKLTQRLLLLVRLLLLLALTLLLANVACTEPKPPPKTINIITPGWLSAVSETEKKQVFSDFVQQQEASFWLLSATPQALSQKQFTDDAAPLSSHFDGVTQVLSVWARLALLLEQLTREQGIAKDTRIAVYASNTANHYRGDKVAFSQPIDWYIVADNSNVAKSSLKISSLAKHIALVGNQHPAYVKSKTALQAIQDVLATDITITELPASSTLKIPEQVDTIIVLSTSATANEMQQALAKWAVGEATRQVIYARDLAWQHRDFALQLAQQLFARDIEQDLWRRIALTNQQIQRSGVSLTTQEPQSLATSLRLEHSTIPPWLVLSIVVLFLLERILSEYPTRHKVSDEVPRA